MPHGTGLWLFLVGDSQHNVVLAPGGLQLGLPSRSCPAMAGSLGLGLGWSCASAPHLPWYGLGPEWPGCHPNAPLGCVFPSEREEERSLDLRSLRQRCLQALAAVSTHTSIVRETVPVLLQHLRKVQKGNAAWNGQQGTVCLGRSWVSCSWWQPGDAAGTDGVV